MYFSTQTILAAWTGRETPSKCEFPDPAMTIRLISNAILLVTPVNLEFAQRWEGF